MIPLTSALVLIGVAITWMNLKQAEQWRVNKALYDPTDLSSSVNRWGYNLDKIEAG